MENPISNEPERFRNRLLETEPITPAYRERYQQEVNAMLERQLRPVEKALAGATGLFCLGCAVWFVRLAATQAGLPDFARGGLLVGALFALAWSIGTLRIIRRGTLRLQADPAAIAAWSWCWGVVITTLFLLVAPRLPGTNGVILALSGLCYLIFGAVSLVNGRVQQAESNTRLKLLEIELTLAQLRETLARR